MSAVEETLSQEATKQLAVTERLKLAPKLIIGSTEFEFDVDPLSPEYQEMAARDLRETPENVEHGLKVLRELIAAEPNFCVPTDKEFLQKFLRPCKWFPESSFELMKRFYQFRINNPTYCKDLVPSNEFAVLNSGVLTPLPRRTSDGVRVLLIESGKRWKPKEISLDQMFRGVILLLEAAITEPLSQVAGVRVILDMEGLSLSQVSYFTPKFASAVVEFVQKCLPCRLKGIHVVNQPAIFSLVFAFFKPFLHQKLRKRIIFHGTDRESLMKYIDAKVLPTRFGGELDYPEKPIGEPFVKYINTFEENFIETNKYGYITPQK